MLSSSVVVGAPPEGKPTESSFEQSIYCVAGGPGILRQLSTSRKAPVHEKANRWIGALHWLPLRIIAVLGQMRQSQAAQGSKKLLLGRSTQLRGRWGESCPLSFVCILKFSLKIITANSFSFCYILTVTVCGMGKCPIFILLLQ